MERVPTYLPNHHTILNPFTMPYHQNHTKISKHHDPTDLGHGVLVLVRLLELNERQQHHHQDEVAQDVGEHKEGQPAQDVS